MFRRKLYIHALRFKGWRTTLLSQNSLACSGIPRHAHLHEEGIKVLGVPRTDADSLQHHPVWVAIGWKAHPETTL